ncbi:MAG: hypothetical protein U0183_20885 [Polyangiaceae bacterium]
MGQSVTIACPSTWDLASFGEVFETIACDDAAKFSKFDDQVQVVAADARWKLIVNETSDAAAAAEEYATNDDLDERFRREVGTLRFFTIRFDDVDVTRRALRAIAQAAVSRGEIAWIDTDYGWVIHACDLLKRIDKNPRWDWRCASHEN